MRFLNHLAVAALMAATAMSTHAAVAIFDGFGDADLNNNGTPLEPADVDVSGSGAGTVAPYIALGNGGTPPVYPTDTMVNEVTAVENASDTGIRWYTIGGWTGAPTPSATSSPRAAVKIINDAVAALPETNPAIGYFHAADSFGGPGAQRFAEAIDDGLALSFDQKGRGNNAAGFFNSQIKLGPDVNDEVKVSFDFRMWFSAANFNSATGINHIPKIGEIRFGLFQDTDHQLGTSNPKAGRLATTTVDDPAIWGQADGNFRGDAGAATLAGANGDHGWFARLPIDDPENQTLNQLGSDQIVRINEELNEGSASDLRIMNGATDTVASGTAAFPQMDIDKVYRITLSLKRFDDPTTAAVTGDAIFAEMTLTERTSGVTTSVSGYDGVAEIGGGDLDGGFESDSWDYFTMTSAGQTTSDDFDWLIDNFMIEVNGSNAPVNNNADFNSSGTVDGEDFLIWQKGFGLTGQLGNKANGNANSDAVVDGQDLDVWKAKFGGPPSLAAGSPVPEPTGAALIAGAVAALASGRRRR